MSSTPGKKRKATEDPGNGEDHHVSSQPVLLGKADVLRMKEAASELEDEKDKQMALRIMCDMAVACGPTGVSCTENMVSELVKITFEGVKYCNDAFMSSISSHYPQVFDMEVEFTGAMCGLMKIYVYMTKSRISNPKKRVVPPMKYTNHMAQFTKEKLSTIAAKCATFNEDFDGIKEICKEVHNMEDLTELVQMICCLSNDKETGETMYSIKFTGLEKMRHSFVKHLKCKFGRVYNVEFHAMGINNTYILVDILTDKSPRVNSESSKDYATRGSWSIMGMLFGRMKERVTKVAKKQ
jgi:hypothetical protein